MIKLFVFMTMNIINSVSELCRLCMSSEKSLISILEISQDSDRVLEKIYTCLLVEIHNSDQVSKKVCEDCLDKVDNFYSFRQLVSDSQEKLVKLLTEDKHVSVDSSSYQQNFDEIEAELKMEFNGKVDEGWNVGDGLVKKDIKKVDYSEPPIPKKSNSTNSFKKCDSLDNVQSSNSSKVEKTTQPDPGGLSMSPLQDESLLDSFANDSLPFGDENEEKCDDPLDLRCNIGSESPLIIDCIISEEIKHKARHNCNECTKSFTSLPSLLKHINRHHLKKQNNVCQKCNIGFKSAEQLKVHSWIHKEVYRCDKCPYTSNFPNNLNLHIMKHNCEYLVTCEECGKGFYRLSTYQEHRANKHSKDIVVHKCNECGKAYHSKGYLRQHLKTHAPGFSRTYYQCETCGKTFQSWKGIKRHTASVHEGSRYKCDVCSKEVTSLQSLKTHKKIHTGEKSYVCDECGKTFLRLNSLIVHRRVHSGEKPYTCQICNKCFSQKSSLNVHMRSHTGERPYSCTLCSSNFTTKSLWETHISTHKHSIFQS